MSTTAGVEGGKELAAAFKALSEKAKNAVEKTLVMGGLQIERDAKLNAPVDTGRLINSIASRLKESETSNPVVEVGTNVEYAKFQEFGTSKVPAHPFLFPAYNANKKAIIYSINKAMQKELSAVKSKYRKGGGSG